MTENINHLNGELNQTRTRNVEVENAWSASQAQVNNLEAVLGNLQNQN